MAELNVQPKKKVNYLAWLLLLAGIAALIWWLTRDKQTDVATVPPADTTAQQSTVTTTPSTDWNGIDFNSPSVNYDEITNKNINVRGSNSYGIYGLGENILFDEGKATLRSDAESNLKEIMGSISKRYNGGEVRVYGYTDSTGSTGSNQQLAQERADAVKNWMQSNGIDAGRISVNAIGEARPVATNATETGRQQNRRVEIVARNSAGSTGANGSGSGTNGTGSDTGIGNQ